MSQNKYHKQWELSRRDPTIDEGTDLLLEIGNPPSEAGSDTALLAALDNSIINGLRRIILSEVPVWGFRQNILVPETFISSDGVLEMGNLTVFSAQQIADRVGMVPIHGDSDRFPDPDNWVFRLCDPKNPNKPLRYEHLAKDPEDLYNRMRYVKVKHIQVYHRIVPEMDAGVSAGIDIGPAEAGAEAVGEVSVIGEGTGAVPTPPVTVAVSRELLNKASAQINFINLDSGEWEIMDKKFLISIFKYPELILAALKKGESLFTEMQLSLGTGGVINPNSMVPNEFTNARWISAIPQYRYKKQKEAREDYNYEEQVQNATDNLRIDREMQPALSKKKITEIELRKVQDYWNNLDGHNLYLFKQSAAKETAMVEEKGEPLSAEQLAKTRKEAENDWQRLSESEKKSWEAQSSRFFINDPEGLKREKASIQAHLARLQKDWEDSNKELEKLKAKLHPPKDTNDPIKDQQEYLLSTDPILARYDMPERWFIRIIYNGHMWPGQIWIRAIEALIAKVESFRMDVLEKIQDFGGRISERASVNFSHDIPNKMQIIIDDPKKIESATLGNLIKSHTIYLLDHLIGENYPNDQYFTVIKECFSSWRVPHPLIPELYLTFKTPSRDLPLFNPKDSFSDLFQDEKNEALRLLKIACHFVLIRLNDLLDEAKEIQKQKGIYAK